MIYRPDRARHRQPILCLRCDCATDRAPVRYRIALPPGGSLGQITNNCSPQGQWLTFGTTSGRPECETGISHFTPGSSPHLFGSKGAGRTQGTQKESSLGSPYPTKTMQRMSADIDFHWRILPYGYLLVTSLLSTTIVFPSGKRRLIGFTLT